MKFLPQVRYIFKWRSQLAIVCYESLRKREERGKERTKKRKIKRERGREREGKRELEEEKGREREREEERGREKEEGGEEGKGHLLLLLHWRDFAHQEACYRPYATASNDTK